MTHRLDPARPAGAGCWRRCCSGVINRDQGDLRRPHAASRCCRPTTTCAKLLRKGAVYSRTTTWVFRAGPVVGLARLRRPLLLVPLRRRAARCCAFPGDLVLFAYLLGLMRFFTVLAALDTGSSFEGMGASREVQFSALAEPALLLGLAALARADRQPVALRACYAGLAPAALAAAAAGARCWWPRRSCVVLLAENARIPVDDPNTHLELTMIHEVMVLDHGGPDFALHPVRRGAEAVGARRAAGRASLLPVRTGGRWLDVAAGAGGHARAGGRSSGVIESTHGAAAAAARAAAAGGGRGAVALLALVAGAEVNAMNAAGSTPCSCC